MEQEIEKRGASALYLFYVLKQWPLFLSEPSETQKDNLLPLAATAFFFPHHRPFDISLDVRLDLPESTVDPALCEQLLVRSLLLDATLVQNEDPIRLAQRRELGLPAEQTVIPGALKDDGYICGSAGLKQD